MEIKETSKIIETISSNDKSQEVFPKEIYPGEVFANTADFDVNIRQLLPRYDELLDTIVACIPSESKSILELGCGTGELTLKLLKHYPKANIIALDYSPRMIQFAKEKIAAAGYENRWQGIQLDFGDWAAGNQEIGNNFDACVSSLAIHHLTDEMKLKLVEKIASTLKSGGAFFNGDPVLPESDFLAEVYQDFRKKSAMENGISLEEVRSKVGKSITYGYSSQDCLATLEDHLLMLKKAGFKTITVPWKYYRVAVFGGFI